MANYYTIASIFLTIIYKQSQTVQHLTTMFITNVSTAGPKSKNEIIKSYIKSVSKFFKS